MGKLVYLFELDSARNTNEEMEQARKALYREIVINGNAVAVTFNQLIDSRFFLSLLNDDEWSDSILKLCRAGAIRFSQFGNYRTASQYLISQALDSNEEFIFSGLRLRSAQKSLIALAKRSLMYSDLTELDEYLSGKRKDEELDALFREQVQTKAEETKDTTLEEKREENKNTLRALYAVLNLILQFGDNPNAYNPPKDYDADKEHLTLHEIFRKVKKFDAPAVSEYPEWEKSVKLLDKIFEKADRKNKRSELLNLIFDEYQSSDNRDGVFGEYALAQAIVNLCYNYACEASISNVSKHYNISELQDPKDSGETFETDFFLHLKKYYGDKGKRKERFLKESQKVFDPYRFKKWRLFNLKRAARLVSHTGLYKGEDETDEYLYPYEYDLSAQKCKQLCRIWLGVGKKLLTTFVYVLIAYFIKNGFYSQLSKILVNQIQGELLARGSSWPVEIVSAFLGAVLVELISKVLGKLCSKSNDDNTWQDSRGKAKKSLIIPSFGESLESFISEGADLICAFILLFIPNRNDQSNEKLKKAERDKVKRIDYISKSVADYKTYRKESSSIDVRRQMFQPSEKMPIFDIEDNEAAAHLTRIEELTGKTFGIAYRSDYHMMVVDPIVETDDDHNDIKGDNIKPYERLKQTSDGCGVVTVPIIKREGKQKFILIKQYRHAVRKEQFNFPRGFGKNGLSSYENAQKELDEEIGAILWDSNKNVEIRYHADQPKNVDLKSALKKLGSITPDSGSQCDTVEIIQANIKHYETNIDHEGIVGSIEVDAEELRQMILPKNGNDENRIDDGLTIGAFMLWEITNMQENSSGERVDIIK